MFIAICYEALKLFRDRITASKLIKRKRVELEMTSSKTACSTRQLSYKEYYFFPFKEPKLNFLF